MNGEPVYWSDEVDEVIRGDLTAAAAYLTSGGGAVVTAVAPVGIDRRSRQSKTQDRRQPHTRQRA